MRLNLRALLIMAIGVFTVSGLVAQGTSSRTSVADKYMISAKAGGVNYAEGTVSVVRTDGKGGVLLKGDQLEIGDRVTTGEDGRAEILLNPGSYLRLGENSSFEFKTTSLDDLQIQLHSGSAMFEVFATEKFRVSVLTPKEKMVLFESGVYRVDLKQDGSGAIYVADGKAAVGNIGSLTLVTGGKMASFGSGPVTVEKSSFNKKDELAQWSKDRSKTLAKMTASLQDSNSRSSLFNSLSSSRWSLYDSFGLWVTNPRNGFSCFLPFGQGWYSPYGYGYRTGLFEIIPTYVPPRPVGPPQGPPQGGTSTGPRRDVPRRTPPVADSPPPFIAIDRQQRNAEMRRLGDNGSMDGDRGRYRSPANGGNPGAEASRSGGSPALTPRSSPVSTPAPVSQPRMDAPGKVRTPIDQ